MWSHLPEEGFDARASFERHYGDIRRLWSGYTRQGVLVLAFDRRHGLLGEVWLKASLDRPRAAIVGRHSMCDLMVTSEHVSVALRHLAIVTQAVSHDDICVRVFDLNTSVGFGVEDGRSLQGVSSDGPMFLRVGAVDLMLLPTPAGFELPEDAATTYQTLPPRVFIDERVGRAEYRPRRAPVPAPERVPGQTSVRMGQGPMMVAQGLLGAGERPAGHLVVRGGGGVLRQPMGPAALKRGVLVGRYPRCEFGSMEASDDSKLSRVHLMVVDTGDGPVAVDTASTNGTMVDGRELRLCRLVDGEPITLAGAVELVWQAA